MSQPETALFSCHAETADGFQEFGLARYLQAVKDNIRQHTYGELSFFSKSTRTPST